MSEDPLLLGEIVGAHGIKGLVKVRSFTEAPEDIVAYGPLSNQDGSLVDITLRRSSRSIVLASIPGINDRNSALAMAGTKLFVKRSVLPDLPPDGEEYYHSDLIGLEVETPDHNLFGVVNAVHNFGAGDILELLPTTFEGGIPETIMVPFNREIVTEIDLVSGRMFISSLNDDDKDDRGV